MTALASVCGSWCGFSGRTQFLYVFLDERDLLRLHLNFFTFSFGTLTSRAFQKSQDLAQCDKFIRLVHFLFFNCSDLGELFESNFLSSCYCFFRCWNGRVLSSACSDFCSSPRCVGWFCRFGYAILPLSGTELTNFWKRSQLCHFLNFNLILNLFSCFTCCIRRLCSGSPSVFSSSLWGF